MHQQITISLLAVGICVLFMSMIGTWNILQLEKTGKYLKQWKVLFFLIIVFLTSYLAGGILIYLGYSDSIHHFVGLILLGGSVFVYLVVKLGLLTIKGLKQEIESKEEYQQELYQYQYKLEEQVIERTSKLELEIKGRERYEQQLRKEQERLHYDLQLAADFQKAVLPQLESTHFIRLAKRYHPCDIVSGDIYNVLLTPEGHLNGFVGDVTGHGVASALMTMMMQIGLDQLKGSINPGELLHEMNSLIAQRNTDKSATGICFSITPEGELTAAHGGHPPMLIIPADGSPAFVFKEGGIPLGMFQEPPLPYIEETYFLQTGDIIAVYTDGLTERENPAGELFGVERLVSFLEKHRYSGIYKLMEELNERLKRFADGNQCNDDLTCLILEYTGRPSTKKSVPSTSF